MGDTGRGYPDGTVHICSFTGQFSAPEKVDDHTYRFKVTSLEYDDPGSESIEDGIRYITEEPYGVINGDTVEVLKRQEKLHIRDAPAPAVICHGSLGDVQFVRQFLLGRFFLRDETFQVCGNDGSSILIGISLLRMMNVVCAHIQSLLRLILGVHYTLGHGEPQMKKTELFEYIELSVVKF
jgi:hypothetical protein